MNVKDLRTLVDNLEEYIHVPGGIERLKKTILHLAVSGQLVPQEPSEGTGQELYKQIQEEKMKLTDEGKLKKQKPLPEISEDEVPFNIPLSWKWARLNDTYDVRDGTHDTPKYVGEGFPLVTSKNLSSGKLDMSNVKFISNSDHLNIKARSEVSKNDVLFAMIGSIGNPVIVDTEQEFSIKNVALFKPYLGTSYSPEWLLINLLIAQNEMKQQSAGGVQAFVSLGFVRSYPSPVPPYSEQLRIIKKIDSIFTLIDKLSIKYRDEQLERRKLVVASLAKFAKGEGDLALDQLTEIIKTKEDAAELRKTILHLAVSGQLVPQDPSGGTGEELYEQIQLEKAKLIAKGKLKKQKPLPEISEDEVPFNIPRSWKWARLQDVGRIVGGGTPASSNSEYYTNEHSHAVAWLTPADLRGFKELYIAHGIRSITDLGLKNSSAQLLPKGTVLFSSRAPIGHLAIAINEITTNQGFKSVVPLCEMSSEYIYRWLQYYGPTIDANASGTTFREVSGAIVSMQLIPLPPTKEQNRITQKVTMLLELVTQLEQHLEKR